MSETLTNEFAVSTVRCSGPNCDHVRQQINHWFVVKIGLVEKTTITEGFACYPYKPDSELLPWEFPVCGQSCAQKKFEKYLATGKL